MWDQETERPSDLIQVYMCNSAMVNIEPMGNEEKIDHSFKRGHQLVNILHRKPNNAKGDEIRHRYSLMMLANGAKDIR